MSVDTFEPPPVKIPSTAIRKSAVFSPYDKVKREREGERERESEREREGETDRQTHTERERERESHVIILQFLCLYGISGTIPTSLGDPTKAQSLRVHSNDLNGKVPASVGDLTNLLDLSS